MTPGVLLVRDAAQADELAGQVRASATRLPQLEHAGVREWFVDV